MYVNSPKIKKRKSQKIGGEKFWEIAIFAFLLKMAKLWRCIHQGGVAAEGIYLSTAKA